MKFFIIFIAIFLISCSSSQKISLGDAPTDKKSKKFVIDNTRYYTSRDPSHFYKIDNDNFNPAPIYKLDSGLSEILSADTDTKAVRVKKLTLYFGYSQSEINVKGGATGAGVLVAGGLGALAAGALAEGALLAKQTHDDTDRQTVGCDFLARYKGRIIEFYISQPVCEGNHVFCISSLMHSPSIDDPRVKDAAEKVAHACVDKAVAQVRDLQNLPPLSEADVEFR